MSLRDGKLAHPCQAVHLAGILVPEKRGGLSVADGQIPVGMLSRFIYIILERTGHWPKGKYLFIRLLVSQNKHAVLIVVPVAGNPVQIALGHKRRFGSHIAPLVIFQILNPALQGLNHFRSLRHKKRQALSDNVHRGKKLHFPPKPVMVAKPDIFQISQIFRQFVLFIKSGSVNSLQHGVFGFASPVSARRRSQLKSFDSLCAHKMRAGAQIGKAALIIERNFRILRQIPDKLHFVRLPRLLHEFDCLRAGQRVPFKLMPFLDYLFHLGFNLIQVLSGKRLVLKIVIIAVINGGPDCQFCLRENPPDRFRQNMGAGMPYHTKPFGVVGRKDI